MSIVVNVSLAVVGLCLFRVAAESGQQPQPQISKTTKALTRILLKDTSEDRFNYVAAPFASSMILALAAEGAEAETKSELISIMGGELPDKNSYKELLTSIKGYSWDGNFQNRAVLKNFVYVYKNFSVLDSFAELARDYYLTDVRTVARPDLEVIRTSHNMGPVSADDNDSTAFNEHAMLIFNGFSMEMNWPTSTWHRTSVSWDGNVIRAFGAAGNFAIGQIPSIDCTAFILPYKNADYAMLVLLPKNKDASLDQVLENLPEIEELKAAMTMKPAFVTVPCFHSTNITSLKTVLQQNTPAKAVFTDSADLSKLSTDKLYLDDVVQQAGARVCVDGASSHSLTSSAYTSQRTVKESVVVDRPFVYMLYNDVNNVVYVAGKLERPVWEDEDEDNGDVEVIKI